MASYRWLAYDLMSGTALAELPLDGPTFGGALCGSGTFVAKMQLPSNNTQLATDLVTATTPERTIVYPERNGVLVGDGYIIWWRKMTSSGPVELRGASLASILRRNRIVADLTYSAADQFTIAQGIINHLQSQPGADFGITVGSDTCGVTRDRTYYAYERKNVGDALAQLGAVDNGFEWGIDVAWSSDANPAPAKTLRLSYPRRGRIAGSTGLVLELKKNVVDYTITEDGSRSARSVDYLGAGDGADMRIATATRTDLLDAGWPLTTEVIAAKDIVEQDTLAAHAVSAVAARAATPTFITVQVDPDDPECGFGQWITGDDVLLKITDHQFPVTSEGRPGLEAYYRVITWQMSVSDDRGETLSTTLGAVE